MALFTNYTIHAAVGNYTYEMPVEIVCFRIFGERLRKIQFCFHEQIHNFPFLENSNIATFSRGFCCINSNYTEAISVFVVYSPSRH